MGQWARNGAGDRAEDRQVEDGAGDRRVRGRAGDKGTREGEEQETEE